MSPTSDLGPGGAPGLVVRRDSPVEALRAVDADADAPPRGWCLCPDRERRSLRRRLAVEGLSPGVARYGSVEDLARALLAADGAPTDVLSARARRRAVESALESADRGELAAFADRVPWRVADALDGVLAEFEDYLACTDAASPGAHRALTAVVDGVAETDPFAAAAAREATAAFRALAVDLDGRTDGVHPTPSHRLRAARRVDDDAWSSALDDPEWLLVAPATLDAPTLRLLLWAARRTAVHLFVRAGTADRVATRLFAAAEEAGVAAEWGPIDPGHADPQAGLVSAAVAGEDVAVGPPAVRSVAAPDRERELVAVLAAVADEDPTRETPGVSTRQSTRGSARQSALIVAPAVADYATPFRDLCRAADRPFRVGSRRRVVDTAAAGAVAAALDLVVAATEEALTGTAVRRALARGVGPPLDAGGSRSGRGGRSPESDPSPGFDPIDAALADALDEGVAPVATHRAAVAEADGPASDRGVALLEWVERVAGNPPGDGRALAATVEGLAASFEGAVRERPPARVDGVAVSPARSAVVADHPAAGAERVRAAAGTVGDAYDAVGRRDWRGARAALETLARADVDGDVAPRVDAEALELVSPAGARFRRADRVYLLGLSAGVFPRSAPRHTYLGRPVRAALARDPGASPLLHLPSRRTRYERAVDAYETALRAGDRVTLVRPYKDAEGRDRPPSPFLDAVERADERRVGVGEWPAADGQRGRLRTVLSGADGRGAGGRTARDRIDPASARETRRRVELFREHLADREDDDR